MDQSTFPLATLPPGEEAIVVEVQGGHGLRNRLTAMGLIPGTPVRLLQNRSSGPVLVQVRDARIALGRGVAHKIIVR